MSGQQLQCVTPKRLPRASWLALVALAWMQLAVAAHQFEHSTAYLEFCEVCVQLERFDNAVELKAPVVEFSRPCCDAVVRRSPAPSVETVAAGFNPRAPPVV